MTPEKHTTDNIERFSWNEGRKRRPLLTVDDGKDCSVGIDIVNQAKNYRTSIVWLRITRWLLISYPLWPGFAIPERIWT